jgi:hypothetical protein
VDSGIAVATEAVMLGLIAGELRRMSGSLIPAIVSGRRRHLLSRLSEWKDTLSPKR